MNFPRREEATNKELILTIIEIQGYLERYGKSHTNWHETLNEVIERLERTGSVTEFADRCRECGREKVLDKIRAEIIKKHFSIVEKNDFDNGRTYGYEEVIDIIDKYKAESEEK